MMHYVHAQFVNDFLSLFDEDIHIYFSVVSKIEYLVLQLFKDTEIVFSLMQT